MAELSIDIGVAGWARVAIPELGGRRVFVRFERSRTGRLAIAELLLAGSSVTSEVLRSIPVGRIEALANAPGAVSAFASQMFAEQEHLAGAFENLIDTLVPRSAMALDEEGNITALTASGGRASVTVVARRRRQLRVVIPDVKVKPDSFYRRVAEMYTDVAAWSSKPAALIAEANGVPPTTVHGWVKEARRRGLLAPGERQRRRNR